MGKRRNEYPSRQSHEPSIYDDEDDKEYLENARQYILAHGINPPKPRHLRGRAIGMWHSKMAKIRKSLFSENAAENAHSTQDKQIFDSAMGDISLSRAQKSEIKSVLQGLPDKAACSSNSYSNIEDSEFKKKFLENINGKLEDHIEKMEVERQNAYLDQMFFEELEQKLDDTEYVEMLKRRSTLPCIKMKDQIIELVETHPVVLISGETGCGKTTQVPQFLLDHFIDQKKGSLCKIVCTQPRRISAISVAERVAEERAEALGLTIGYQIRLEKVSPRSRGSMTFCTTGVVLRQMQRDPCLSEYSHIIIDEIHERDIQSDFLITLLKQVITRRKDLRVILMSATLNAETFSQYFDNCPHLNIPGFTYHVEEYFLEDALLSTRYEFEDYAGMRRGRGQTQKVREFISFIEPHIKKLKKEREYDEFVYRQLRNPSSEKLDLKLIYCLLLYICRTEETKGAVLVFLPGFAEISELHKLITSSADFPSRKYLIIPLHSQMPTIQQHQVFDTPPHGVRKIIISTNIAETSITIDDVEFVIDCGMMKVKSYDKITNSEALESKWVSKANASQRKGRAGRVKPGVCYHLISKARYETLDTYTLPEILRIRLENVILTAKILQLGKIEDFFAKLMNSPDPSVVTASIELLKRLEALDDNESLTPLGYHLARLPLSPQIGKMLLFGALFNCLEPVLNIAVVLDYRDPFVLPIGKEKEADKKRRELAGRCTSDHIFMHNLIKEFESLSDREKRSYCWEFYLSYGTMKQLEQLKEEFMQNLHQLCFVPNTNPTCRQCNCNSKNVDLIRAVICAGLYPNIAVASTKGRRKPISILHLLNGKKVDFHPKSILSKQHLDCSLFVYYNLVKSKSMYIHDGTPVDPLHLIFFGDNFDQITEKGLQFITINSLKFRCEEGSSSVIKALKCKLNNFLEYQISHPNVVDLRKDNEATKLFRTIIEVLNIKELDYCNESNDSNEWNDSYQSNDGNYRHQLNDGNYRHQSNDGNYRYQSNDGNYRYQSNYGNDRYQSNDRFQSNDGNDRYQLNDANDRYQSNDGYQLYDGNDEYQPNDGNDIYQSNDGNDRYQSNDGNDGYQLYDGNDEYQPNDGNDRYQSNDGNDRYQSNDGNDRFQSNDGNDGYQLYDGNDEYQPNDGNDRYQSNDGNDRYQSNDGNDRYQSNDGNDGYQLYDGNDEYQPNDGSDRYQSDDGHVDEDGVLVITLVA